MGNKDFSYVQLSAVVSQYPGQEVNRSLEKADPFLSVDIESAFSSTLWDDTTKVMK